MTHCQSWPYRYWQGPPNQRPSPRSPNRASPVFFSRPVFGRAHSFGDHQGQPQAIRRAHSSGDLHHAPPSLQQQRAPNPNSGDWQQHARDMELHSPTGLGSSPRRRLPAMELQSPDGAGAAASSSSASHDCMDVTHRPGKRKAVLAELGEEWETELGEEVKRVRISNSSGQLRLRNDLGECEQYLPPGGRVRLVRPNSSKHPLRCEMLVDGARSYEIRVSRCV